jgi:hypothetical protein
MSLMLSKERVQNMRIFATLVANSDDVVMVRVFLHFARWLLTMGFVVGFVFGILACGMVMLR